MIEQMLLNQNVHPGMLAILVQLVSTLGLSVIPFVVVGGIRSAANG